MYDFDKIWNRRGTNSLKWDVSETELPMWVADMDFQTSPEIQEAIQAKASQGIFGYTNISEEWYQAYIQWWKKRHAFEMKKEWLIFCTGVVPAISSIVRKLTTPAEKVLVLTPCYPVFYSSIENNGRQVLQCPLKYDGIEYRIDFADLEGKLSDPQTALMLLCNPHNPVGKIWDKEALARIGELCARYHVTVVSDEIHCDLTEPGFGYTPFASVSQKCRDNSITCIAPTKAFNLAGLQTAAVLVPDEGLRHKVWRGLNTDEIAEPGFFAVAAAVAAFTKGGGWLDALCAYLSENKKAAVDFINQELPQLRAVPSQATYLLWLDCTGMPGSASDAAGFIRSKTGLYLSEGKEFRGNGSNFLRMNIACPRSVLKDGLTRLKQGISEYEVWAVNLC